jgi:uncharacterized protein YbbC (DUF1343 family)
MAKISESIFLSWIRNSSKQNTFFFTFIIPIVVCFFNFSASAENGELAIKFKVGAERYQLYSGWLKNKNVGLVVNQTSRVGQQHLVDFLLQKEITVKAIFSPEHGFKGNYSAGKWVESGNDKKTGIPIISLYGKNKQPKQEDLKDIDLLIFDIQDVGVRFYTYISSMHYVMKSAKELDIPLIILDRPNPNGRWVDGPTLDPKYRSFVGMHPIPLLHGMTVGELALMIEGEGWLEDSQLHRGTNKSLVQTDNEEQNFRKKPGRLDLRIIPIERYTRTSRHHLSIKPSPNLPNDLSIAWYPSLAFFEATPVSIGRGTDFPFQVIGHDRYHLGKFEFQPRSIKGVSDNPKLEGLKAWGTDLRDEEPNGLVLQPLLNWYKLFSTHNQEFFTRAKFFDQLAGTSKLRQKILAGMTEEQIRATWKGAIRAFCKTRKSYLLYPDSVSCSDLAIGFSREVVSSMQKHIIVLAEVEQ